MFDYSEEILKRFRNPKNYGEIKNASGIGKVGNPTCLLPETMIHSNDKSIQINKIDKKMRVLGHNGFYNKVTRTFERKYAGNILCIGNKFGRNFITPGHEVLAVKVPKRWKYSFSENKRTLSADWYHSNELEKGDLIAYPIMKEEKDTDFIEFKQEKKKWDFRSKRIPVKIKIDKNFLRLAGYYLSEGSLREKVSKTYVAFSFSSDEEDLVEDVVKIVKNSFGVEAKKKSVQNKRVLHVTVNNVWFTRLFKSLFGKGAAKKKIPHWIMVLPKEKQKSLLHGLWKGDGYFNKKKPRAGYSTISYQLVQQIKILLLRQGISPSIYTEVKKISKDGTKHRTAYRIHVGERKSLKILADILEINFFPKIKELVHSWFDKNYLYIPITKIEVINYNGVVKNLKVENAMSYTTDTLCVHNCGDVLWLYIKVEKNKKGEEIIKDVKFKTLGCLPPYEEVLINEGNWSEINSVNKQDYVLNSNGDRTKVLDTYVREYNGNILTIVPFVSRFNGFSLTPNHPVLCIKRKWLKSARRSSNKCKWLRIDEKELLSMKPNFIEAKNLEVGDYLFFVSNRRIKNSPIFTKNIVKLLGYYLAEGYITPNGVLNFALNKNEKDKIFELKSLLLKVTGKKPKERVRRTAIEIYICSKKWSNFFVSLGGKYAINKRLSDDILVLPFKKQWEMIKTYIKGDGNLYKRRLKDSPIYRISTSSRKLAIQVQEILARGGIFSSIKKEGRIRLTHYIEGRRVNCNPNYEVSFKLQRKHKFVHANGKYFLVPIKRIEKKHYSGKVYNFQVIGEPNSYLVKGFAVHNCPAAIAVSDMVVDLAKGKTVEEARKITNKLIADKLKKLPKQKYHCSLLGEQALKKAIDDYLSKKKK